MASRILVVGDVMVDSSWLVREVQSGTSSQLHGGIVPRALIEPTRRTDVLGGASTIARRIVATTTLDVVLVGGWTDDCEAKLRHRADLLVPELGLASRDRIRFVRAARTEFDAAKWRIYSPDSEGITRFRQRLDRDLSVSHHKETKAVWPKPSEISCVVVADFAKGFLDLTNVRSALAAFSQVPFILRTKRQGPALDSLLAALPWSLLAPNREDFVRMLGCSPLGSRTLVALEGEDIRVHPRLLAGLADAKKRLHLSRQHRSARSVFVKLDREGGVLLHHGQSVVPIFVDEKDRGSWAGVSAGDVWMADVAVQLVRTPPAAYSDLKGLAKACASAVGSATHYVRAAEDIRGIDGWYARSLASNGTCVARIGGRLDLVRSLRNWNDVRGLKRVEDLKRIELHRAAWYLPGFLTLSESLGAQIEAVQSRLAAYADHEDQSRKPLVSALCGPPGAGKSTLARALARSINASLIEANVAQWRDADDLFDLCERIRTEQIRSEMRPPLVFLDEVDTSVGNANLYGRLLSPLWDRSYSLRGEVRDLGPAIFLLAGSTLAWQDGNRLLGRSSTGKKQSRPEKLDDLVSRFALAPLTIPDLGQSVADRVHIVGTLIRRRFPEVQAIETATLRVLVKLKPVHGARSLFVAIGDLSFREISTVSGRTVRLAARDRENEEVLRLHFLPPGSAEPWLSRRRLLSKFVEIAE